MGHVTRARLTQILNLLCRAPDLQESILFLPPVFEGKDPITERQLRGLVAEVDWGKQRRKWAGSQNPPQRRSTDTGLPLSPRGRR